MSSEINEKRLFSEPTSQSNCLEPISKMFPDDTKIVHFQDLSDSNYTASLRLKCSSKEEFKIWLAKYEGLSKNNYRVAKTVPSTGKTVTYKAVYRCQHNTYPDSHYGRVKAPSKKHTGCNATLKVTVKSSVEGRRFRGDLKEDIADFMNMYKKSTHTEKITFFQTKNPTKLRCNFFNILHWEFDLLKVAAIIKLFCKQKTRLMRHKIQLSEKFSIYIMFGAMRIWDLMIHLKKLQKKCLYMKQKVMYAKDEESLKESFVKIQEAQAYPVNRFNDFYPRLDDWLSFEREHLQLRKNYTNNYSEAVIRTLKDVVLQRTKAPSITTVIEYCMTTWEDVLIKLLDFAFDRQKTAINTLAILGKKMQQFTVGDIKTISPGVFSVPSSSVPNAKLGKKSVEVEGRVRN